MRALAVFHDKDSAHWANRWLKPGFWHVFVCVVDPGIGDGYWLRVDAMEGVPTIELLGPTCIDLAKHYREQGMTVIEVEAEGKRPIWPWMKADCVGVAKMLLGVKAPWVLTPWQLHQRLTMIDARRGAAQEMANAS